VNGVSFLKFGSQINIKFNTDGSPRRYPGNTVISDICPDNKAFGVIKHLTEQLKERNLDDLFILLPDNSYHVTIIRGVNDLVRTKDYWPPAIPLDAPMDKVDNFVRSCVESVEAPETVHMRFSHVQIDDADLRICLEPADKNEDKKLREYRDNIAEKLNLRLPGHDNYVFHITAAYVKFIPEENRKNMLEKYTEDMNMFLKQQESFELPKPRFAYYNDMFYFYDTPIDRSK